MAFKRKGIVGRPAKPGETVDRRGIPVTTPRPGSTPAKSKKPNPRT